MALYKFIPSIRNWREAMFTGWFGPIGVGALFYYTVALESIPADGPNAHARQMLEPVVYFMVLSSIVAHGITIPLFYIGTFATRTLTKTSDNGTQVLRIPKIEMFRKNSPMIDESDLTDLKPAGPKKFTAITILTPDEIPEHMNRIRDNSNHSHSPELATKSLASSRKNSLDVLDYLPDDDTNSNSQHDHIV
jgi:hypothetical protein